MTNLFGNYKDNGKEKSMSFRVSKETQRIFDIHSKKVYGGRSEGLKKIFLDYMSKHAFKRQSLNYKIRIYVPRKGTPYESKPLFLPFQDHIQNVSPMYFKDLDNVENIVISGLGIVYSKERDEQYDSEVDSLINEDYQSFLTKYYPHPDVDIRDFLVVEIALNNFLDYEMDGIYSNNPNSKNDSWHSGLNIVDYNGEVYYISYSFEIDPSGEVVVHSPLLLSNGNSYNFALDCGNIELSKLIDRFNDGTSNIQKNKQLLNEKRENLLKQLEEIDKTLSKLD